MLKFVYGIFPAFVFYTDNLAEWQGGCANGPVVRIRTKYKDVDTGILQHELTHVKQFYRMLGFHGLLYLLFDTYRYRSEIEAYRVQLDCYGTRNAPPTWCIDAIMTKYRLSITVSQILKDLMK